MFKKSFSVVIIQVIGIILSLISVYFIAGSMEPEVYSLIGVYGILTTIILTFSDLGLETVMGREALYWISNGDEQKFKEYASQSIFSRIIGFVILLPLLFIYIVYLNVTKYNSLEMPLLTVMLFGAFLNMLSDSMSLMIRSRGGYVFSQMVKTSNAYLIKTIGIGLYFVFGARCYLYFYSLSSMPMVLILIIKLRKNLSIKEIQVKQTFHKIIAARYLWLNTDFNYLRSNMDSMVVSAIFPASIMGSYTILKTLQNMCRGVIEGFFDVLSQSTVKYKGNKEALEKKEKKIKLARNIFIIGAVIGIIIFSINTSFFVSLLNLKQYEGIVLIVYSVMITSIILLVGKYEINAIAFFANSKLIFIISIVSTILSLFSYVWLLPIYNLTGMLLQQITIFLINSIIPIIVFQKYKEDFYTKINK